LCIRLTSSHQSGCCREDNFQLHLNLITLTKLLRQTDSSLRSQAEAFFLELSERNEGKERGPWLALLHLEKELPSDHASSRTF
jgi:hypothetical protein